MPNNLAGSANRPTITVGGRVFIDLTNLIILHGHVESTGRYTTLRTPNGTGGYQVTAGKTLTIYAIKIAAVVSATIMLNLLYGDTDVGYDAAGAPTTPITMAGWAASKPNFVEQANAVPSEFAIKFAVPAAKYAAIQGLSAGNTSVQAYAYEA